MEREGGGVVAEVVHLDVIALADHAPAVTARSRGQQDVENAIVADAADRVRPGVDDLVRGLAVESAMRAVVVGGAPAVAEFLEVGGGEAQLDAAAFDAEPVAELLAGAQGLAFGDVVADVAGDVFEQVVAEGLSVALDVAFAFRGERGAQVMLDVEGVADAADVVGDVIRAVVGFEGFGDAPVEQAAPQQGGDGGGGAGFADLNLEATAVHVEQKDEGVAAVGEFEVGGGGVGLPLLIQGDDGGAGVADGALIGGFPAIRVAELAEQAVVDGFPVGDPAGDGFEAGQADGAAVVAGTEQFVRKGGAGVGLIDDQRTQGDGQHRLLVDEVVAPAVAVLPGETGEAAFAQLARPAVELVGGDAGDDGNGLAVDLAAIPGGGEGFLVELAAGVLASGGGVCLHEAAKFLQDVDLGVHSRQRFAAQVRRQRVARGFDGRVGQCGQRRFVDYTDGAFGENLPRFGFEQGGLGGDRKAG